MARKQNATASGRSSRQREAIAHYLESGSGHPTAEQVLHAVRKKIPSLGLATVYRNLETLVGEGRASRTMHAEGARYDSRVDPHHHFVCAACGSIENVEAAPEEAAWMTRFQKRSGALVHRVMVEIRGLCKRCRRR